jgi:alcohol dehydrogenase class IV
MSRPEVWDRERLLAEPLGDAVVWSTRCVQALVEAALDPPILSPDQPFPPYAATLIVFGGGTLMDRAKQLRRDRSPGLRLIVVPTLWGSGAEGSRIVVLSGPDGKTISVDDENLPDVRVHWPELCESVPENLARFACGDAWAHALESLLSPLGTATSREEAGAVLRRMMSLPLAWHADWLECSLLACKCQAASSVGLVHGIAHRLETPLLRSGKEGWGHARLCSLYLTPVQAFVRQSTPKWDERVRATALDPETVSSKLRPLFNQEDYSLLLPFLEAHWKEILRDPCTRTNAALVRPSTLDFFREFRQ